MHIMYFMFLFIILFLYLVVFYGRGVTLIKLKIKCLFCAVLFYSVLFRIVLCCAILCYAVLLCSAQLRSPISVLLSAQLNSSLRPAPRCPAPLSSLRLRSFRFCPNYHLFLFSWYILVLYTHCIYHLYISFHIYICVKLTSIFSCIYKSM